jgi:hypothetical protein
MSLPTTSILNRTLVGRFPWSIRPRRWISTTALLLTRLPTVP